MHLLIFTAAVHFVNVGTVALPIPVLLPPCRLLTAPPRANRRARVAAGQKTVKMSRVLTEIFGDDVFFLLNAGFIYSVIISVFISSLISSLISLLIS
jgi:hypothetical protein